MAETYEKIKTDKQKRNIEGKAGSAQVIRLALTDTLTSTASDVADGTGAVFNVHLYHASGLRLFATPQFSLFEDSVAGTNYIPEGSNLSAGDYEIQGHLDRGRSDGNDYYLVVTCVNNSGDTHDIILWVNWKYLAEGEESGDVA